MSDRDVSAPRGIPGGEGTPLSLLNGVVSYRALVVMDGALVPLSTLLSGLFVYASLHSRPRWMVALHLLASSGWSLVTHRLLPVRLRRPMLPALAFLFVIALSLPLLGPLGLVSALLAALHAPRRRAKPLPWLRTQVPDLPHRPLQTTEEHLASGGVLAVVDPAADLPGRLRVVMATREMRDHTAVPILNQALADPIDEVRLLAYSMLQAREKKISARITAAQAQLDRGAAPAWQARRRLAMENWELAYLGFVQGAALDHVLEQARVHAEAALAEIPGEAPNRLGLLLLLGRILLRKNQPGEAREALLLSLEAGQSREAVLPYLAEALFLERNFRALRGMVRQFDVNMATNPVLGAIWKRWA